MNGSQRLLQNLTAVFCCAVLLLLCTPYAQATAPIAAPLTYGNTQNGMVRVYLSSLGNPATLKFTVHGSYTVNGSSSRSLQNGSTVTVQFNSSTGRLSLTINGSVSDMGTSFKLRRHATSGENGLTIAQGRVPANLYPGDFHFLVRGSAGSYKLYVIAYIYMEDYLYGVLPYEMGNSSGLEALKAQAVAARTYTMRAMSAAASNLYDVVDTTADQVYSGTPSGNGNCKAAVDATKGIVLKYGDAFTATYYTASNGGQTESIKNAWGTTSYPYLTVKDDPYDLANTSSRKNSFTVNASGSQSNTALGTLLNQKASAKFGAGAYVTGVSAVTPHSPRYASPSRLYTKLDFNVSYILNGTSGTGTLTFDIFNELESPLGMGINSGNNELWSVSQTSTGFTVYARRYGHGIGMSQRGAMYMAQMGYTYDQILGFYFEGCTQVQYTLNRSILSAVVDGQDSQEQVIPENPADIPVNGDGTATVRPFSGSSLLLRYETSEASYLIAELPAGATVRVYRDAGTYLLVGYGALCGYALKAGLAVSGNIPNDGSMQPTQLYGHGTVVNSNALNLRPSPSMNSSVLTTIPGNTVLPVFGVSDDWASVQYGLRTGYVSLDYLRLEVRQSGTEAPEPTPAPSSDIQQARVTTASGSLNLRASPSDSARVLLTIPQYTVINVANRGPVWCQTSYNNVSGYVMTKFLTFLSDAGNQTPVPAATPNVENALWARVTTASGSLNLRASANGKVLRTIPQNEVISVLERSGDWCKVRYEGHTGFVMTRYLSFLSADEMQQPTPAPTAQPFENTLLYGRVTTAQGSLNLRESPSSSARVLCTIPQYEYVPVLERGSVWCRVQYQATTGYVMSSFLTIQSGTEGTVNAQTTVIPSVSPQSAFGTARVVTPSGSLNLRETAWDNARILRTIPQSATVTVLQQGADWCRVLYESTYGYVMTKYLSFGNAESTPAPTQTPVPTVSPNFVPVAYAYVNTAQGSLNLRSAPADNASVYCAIPQYTRIPVLQRGDTWCAVVYNCYTGYAMTQYLAFEDENSSVAPMPTNEPETASANSMRDGTLRILQIPVGGKVVCPSSSLNLRAGCSTEADILLEIPKDDYVVITEAGSAWCKVEYEGTVGYSMTQYLEFTLYE